MTCRQIRCSGDTHIHGAQHAAEHPQYILCEGVRQCGGAVTVDAEKLLLLTVLRVMALSAMGFEAETLLILCDLTSLAPTLRVCVQRLKSNINKNVRRSDYHTGDNTNHRAYHSSKHAVPNVCILTARHPHGEARFQHLRLRGRAWSQSRRCQGEPAAWGWLVLA